MRHYFKRKSEKDEVIRKDDRVSTIHHNLNIKMDIVDKLDETRDCFKKYMSIREKESEEKDIMNFYIATNLYEIEKYLQLLLV